MADLINTPPPPSYEDAISVCIAPPNQFIRSVPSPTTKSSDHLTIDEILSAPLRPLIPRPSISIISQRSQYEIGGNQTNRRASQQNTVQRQTLLANDNKTCFCLFITIFSLGFFIFLLVMIVRLNTPPPSYETATGIQAGQNPYFHNVLVSPTTPYNDDLMPAANTVPILSQQFGRRQSPQIRSRSPELQSNTILRQQESQFDPKTCVCFVMTLTFIIGLMICLVVLLRSIHGKTNYMNSEKVLQSQKNDDKLWLNLNKRMDESKWNFQTIHKAQEND